jgi:DNA-binding transcriptional ArsR family regulator
MAYEVTIAALADPTRRAMIERLRQGPIAVGALAAEMPVSRPAVSQHLKVLSDAGLLRVTQKGTRRLYQLDPKGLAELRAYLDGLWDDALRRFAARAQEIAVPLPPERAFRLFTEEMADWWPLETHSLSGQENQTPANSVEVPSETGAQVLETKPDGSKVPWGASPNMSRGALSA